MGEIDSSPLLKHKAPGEPSVFQPESLIREARRQKGLPSAPVPAVCVLDPDGDIVRHLRGTGQASRCGAWPCYHSELDRFRLADREIGVVGCAVGAPYAVLVAEQMFALGCELLISVTSAGQIVPAAPPPYFVLIDRALRDEGTSHHYLPPSAFADADSSLIAAAAEALRPTGVPFHVGATWTTDAPFRETERAVDAARAMGLLGVEMEAAALYAFAAARRRRVLCLAHVTNTMGLSGEDFEKGEANGARDALQVLGALVVALPVGSARRGAV
jgi:uridine phosphorylase